MKLLAIDTATEACSAALFHDGAYLTKYRLAPRRHAELILPMVDELFAESGLRLSELDAIAFGRGPGAFTGVRIAAGVAQGLALAGDLPVIPVSELAALAQAAAAEAECIACAIDARMSEVYWGCYQTPDDLEQGVVRLIGKESVCLPSAVEPPGGHRCFGVGSGWGSYATELQQALGGCVSGFKGDAYPTAAAVCRLAADAYQGGRTVDAAEALPVYLRNQVTSAR